MLEVVDLDRETVIKDPVSKYVDVLGARRGVEVRDVLTDRRIEPRADQRRPPDLVGARLELGLVREVLIAAALQVHPPQADVVLERMVAAASGGGEPGPPGGVEHRRVESPIRQIERRVAGFVDGVVPEVATRRGIEPPGRPTFRILVVVVGPGFEHDRAGLDRALQDRGQILPRLGVLEARLAGEETHDALAAAANAGHRHDVLAERAGERRAPQLGPGGRVERERRVRPGREEHRGHTRRRLPERGGVRQRCAGRERPHLPLRCAILQREPVERSRRGANEHPTALHRRRHHDGAVGRETPTQRAGGIETVHPTVMGAEDQAQRVAGEASRGRVGDRPAGSEDPAHRTGLAVEGVELPVHHAEVDGVAHDHRLHLDLDALTKEALPLQIEPPLGVEPEFEGS